MTSSASDMANLILSAPSTFDEWSMRRGELIPAAYKVARSIKDVSEQLREIEKLLIDREYDPNPETLRRVKSLRDSLSEYR